ncbi:hypothetical protein [Bartonella birtlesii]|uniref:hypothetical protein n=1 Tax=Bartonella birtlesii TaxID=111504 RepID=UPI00037F1B32|nr:hypothetical protein [Bartonella birtlesii]
MVEDCRSRIIFTLFAFLVFFTSLFAFRNVEVQRFLSNRSFSSSQVNITEGMLLERMAVFFPDIIMHLSKLNHEEQKKLVERVRCDMIAIAFANGHNSEQAQKLGRIVAMVLSKAISHPSIASSYF